MGSAGVHSAASRLNHAIKTLLEHWDATSETWNDAVRKDYEERHVAPLESAVKVAMGGMQDIAEVLGKVRRDCSDRNDTL